VKRPWLVAALTLLVATPVWAQTNDRFFRSWRWADDETDPRAAGLAGAMTAAGDEAGAVRDNPAGLASLDKAEVVGGLLSRTSGTTPVGDSLDARTDLAFVAAAARVGHRVVLAAYLSESQAGRVTLSGARFADGLADTGSLEAVVSDFGAGFAFRITPRLHLGGRLSARHLSLDGAYTQEPEAGPTVLRVETSGSATKPTGSLGLVVDATSRLRFGLVSTSGTSWELQRQATSPELGVVLDPGSSFTVRAPRTDSFGVSVRPSLKVMFSAQIDRVAYHEIQRVVVIARGAHARDEYVLDDAWEPRLGVEASFPLRSASLQLRAGVRWRGPNALSYVGSDPAEAQAFVGAERKAEGAIGASLVTARWLRFDAAASFGGDRTRIALGTAVRF
jgi:hypothetical protein